MKTQIFRYILYSIIASLTCLNLTAASSPPSGENRVHFCGVTEQQSDTRRYARSLANLDVGAPRMVRLIYFTPNDQPYRADVVQRMKDQILNIQTFYAEQMKAHGYGFTTFRIETDTQGGPIVHRVDAGHPDSYYVDDLAPVFEESERAFNLNAYISLIVLDNSSSSLGGGQAGLGERWGKNSGYAVVTGKVDFGVAAHELGHAFGLEHDFRDGAYIMSYGPGWNQLSACSAEFLSVHPYFNPDIPIERGHSPTIELISPRTYPAGSRSVPIRFQVNDSGGLHQVLLRGLGGLIECRGLAGETDALVEFNYDGAIAHQGLTLLSDAVAHRFFVEAVNTDGNWSAYMNFSLTESSPHHIAILEGHTRWLHSVSFSPDGRTLASGGDDWTVKLWDVVTQQDIATLPHGAGVTSVAFSHDGMLLASGSRDGTVKLWEVTTQQDIGTLPHGAGITSVAFSHDGMLLASGSRDGTVKLWEVTTQQDIGTLPHGAGITSVAFSRDGMLLASGSQDKTVKLWDVAARQNIGTLDGHSIWVNSVSFSPDERTLASTGGNTVKLWDVTTQRNIGILPHGADVGSVSFSRDGGTLASGAVDGTVKLWDVASCANFATLGNTSGVNSLSFSSDGVTLASGTDEGMIELWDTSGLIRERLEAVAEIDIPDPNLRAAIATALGKPQSASIVRGHLENLTDLYARDANISNLTGLEFATKLTSLNLGNNNISDISAVAGLTKLKVLELGDSNISDISVVAGLTNLTFLNLWGNNISDISVVAGLTKLASLYLGGNNISDISVVAGLTNLAYLYLGDNNISNISVVAGLTNLASLNLLGNNISDISAVAGLTKLTLLNLWGNNISDISVVAGLTKLASLYLGGNNISDISVVAGLTNLTYLDLGGNNISDISAVAGLTKLTSLHLWDNNISDISVVAGLTKLKLLELGDNNISNIAVVTGLTNLTFLSLWGNNISDISVVAGITKLARLYLERNNITDISPLVANTGLGSGDEVYIVGNPLSYPSIYTHIPVLQERGVEVFFDNRTPQRIRIVSGNDQQGLPGAALKKPFVIEVQDVRDDAFEGVPVTFTVMSGDGTLSATSTATNTNGRAESTLTLGPNPGTNTVTVSVAGSQEKETFNAEGVRTPKTLEIFSGGDQEGAPGAALENPFVVEVRDQTDKPLPGVQVTFSVSSGGGTLSATSAMADVNGRAESILTLGPNPGTNTVTVFVTGTQQTETFTAGGIRIPLAFWIISGDKQQGLLGEALANPFVVEVRDQSGDPLPGVQVTFSVTGGGGTLSVTSAMTDNNGRVKSTLTLGPNPGTNTVEVAATGIHRTQSVSAIAELPPIPQDVNRDDMVNILDLVLVASVLGDEGHGLVADVNEDGIVNILDLVLVAGAFGNAAAPSAWYRDLEEDLLSGVAIAFPIRSLDPSLSTRLIAPTRAEVGQWLAQAGELGLTDATSQRGVLFLEQLFAALTPKETALLPNYPNPFNPETWIPYQLANGMNVQISIYDISGELVRQLDLGHQRAGHYTERSRAAYWDGRNGGGERVASGVYFYTLAADTFRSTRKMLVGK